MSDLNEIIDFGSRANPGFADRRAINCCIGPDFNEIFQDDAPGLNDLVMATIFLFGKTKTFASRKMWSPIPQAQALRRKVVTMW